jgi:hypothetical protein
MVVVFTGVSTSSAARPDWYPQLRLAVLDAGHTGVEIAACTVPNTAKPKAGRSCEIVSASDENDVLQRVLTWTDIGKEVGPCRRLLFALDHSTSAAADRAVALATYPAATVTKDASARSAIRQDAKQLSVRFSSLQHCLGIGKS